MSKCYIGFYDSIHLNLQRTHRFFYIYIQRIVLFKSIGNSKRRNKGNFTLKKKRKKIKLGGGGGQHYLALNKISTL